ncbi:hypothetical protein BKA93DRAFT_740856 [Sparassis latifolia]
MARATRSTAQLEKDKPADVGPPARKTGSKKRKRTSLADSGDQPAAKQVRTDIKEEGSQEPEEHPPNAKPVQLPGSGDVPIEPSDAEKILDVLEMVDTQGLLDRVFPLPDDTLEPTLPESVASPSTLTRSYSFRALLKNSSDYPLRVLRSAVQHLFPISSHPRSRPSAPAAQQLRFCNLALSLLDQASFHSSPISLDVESLIPILDSSSADHEDVKLPPQPATGLPSISRKRKYALVQHMPSGDWWTSLNSSTALDSQELKDLPTAHAEFVSILPSASTSTVEPVTLAAYAKKNNSSVPPGLPGPRQLSCGRFLDYGPYAGFAPSFDQGGAEVGRMTLGEVVWRQEQKRRLQGSGKGKQRAWPGRGPALGTGDDVEMFDGGAEEGENVGDKKKNPEVLDLSAVVESLLPPDQVAVIKAALGSLELEEAVQELLDKNARALVRLEVLQLGRFGAEGGGSSVVEVGSEEWDVAHGILDSLTLLASLRPRSSLDDSPPFVPPASVLHKLHRTLPTDETQGWYGTLPEGRTTALRDDTTIQVKSGAAMAPIPAAPPIPATPTTVKAAAPAYNPYTYSNYSTSAQYRGGYGTYTPGQASTYYPSYTAPTQTQTSTGTHYPGQQYNTNQQYPYSSWHNYPPSAQPQAAGSVADSTSGRATPQPGTAVTSPTTVATNYASFFASTAQQPQPQRAVANTVVSTASKLYQSWSPTQAQAPTLPPLPRSVATPSAPETPRPATPGGAGTYAGQRYLADYQPTTSAAR